MQPTLEHQPTLLGEGDPAIGSWDAVTRTALDAASWIDHAPGWLTGGNELFDELLLGLSWEAHRRPMYERVVDVPRLTHFDTAAPLPPVVGDVADTPMTRCDA